MKVHALISAAALHLAGALAPAAPYDHTHSGLQALLQKHVTAGAVNYKALKADTKSLDAYLDASAAVPESEFKKWNENQQLAFLINVYNASTLKLILDNYPLKSIKDIGGIFRSPFDQEAVRLFGSKKTLNHLEHEVLRKKYSEPRVHFAIVCASVGCPPLRSEAFIPEKLDEQLNDQARTFLSQTSKNWVDPKKKIAHLSPIFKWFKEDFEKKSGHVLTFVTPLFPDQQKQQLSDGGYKVEYTDYDWSLNEKK